MILRVVDIETTGMEPPAAEVVELGWQDVTIDDSGGWCVDLFRGTELFGSERPCPPEVLAVHHILDHEREGLPTFLASPHASHVHSDEFVGVAHNAEFEQRFISGMFRSWICTYKVALRVWPDAPSHGNQALMYLHGLQAGIPADQRQPAHRALPDAIVTAHILRHLLATSGLTVDEMVRITSEPRLLPTCPIGKFRGRKWPEVEQGFLTWMLGQRDMDEDLKWNARREIERRRTEYMAGR